MIEEFRDKGLERWQQADDFRWISTTTSVFWGRKRYFFRSAGGESPVLTGKLAGNLPRNQPGIDREIDREFEKIAEK